MSHEPALRVPDPAAMLRNLPEPALDIDEEAGDDLRRIELRRSILDIAEVTHAAEADLVRAAVDRFRRPADEP
jgi:hypothetical protein